MRSSVSGCEDDVGIAFRECSDWQDPRVQSMQVFFFRGAFANAIEHVEKRFVALPKDFSQLY